MALDLEKLLNGAQLEAATITAGPVCIVAGAGSGKTRVITHRLANLVEKQLARPEECLAVTFTNKAARELKDRVDRLLPGVGGRLWVSTFHSAAARILREAHGVVGLPRSFVIYDQDDAERLLRTICEEQNIATDMARTFPRRIEQLQHKGITPDRFEPDQFDVPGRTLRNVYPVYVQRLRQAGAVDFGGLIMLALQVLREQPTASHSVARIRHAVVDEYQDVDDSQAGMVEALAPRLASLAVVGDDDQAIYRWRGASAYSLLRFTEKFPAARTVKLTENYRSSGRILALANEVIRANPGRMGKELWTSASSGTPIRIRMLQDDRDEAAFVVNDLANALREGHRANEIAVLYRTNAQSRVLEEAMTRQRLRYRMIGGLRFYERREVKDVLAYLRLVANPDSEMDLRRVINVPPRAIGDKTVEQLSAVARQHGRSMTAALELPAEAFAALGMRNAGRAKLEEFGTIMRELRRAAEGQPPSVVLTEIVALTRYDVFLRTDEDGEERLKNLESLHKAAGDYEADVRAAGDVPTLEGFLERVSLQTSEDEADSGGDAVTLMTLHSAKGLEYDFVYMVGVEDNVLPGARATEGKDPEDMHEERRLCYVGMTRARQRLTISLARRRMTWGETRPSEPSRFLKELSADFVRANFSGDLHAILPFERPAFSAPSRPQPARTLERGDTRVVYDDAVPVRRSPVTTARREVDFFDEEFDDEELVDTPPQSVARGARVRHEMYGQGRVLAVSGTGPNARVDVEFPGQGVRKIVARFLSRA